MMRSELPHFQEIKDDKKRIALEYSLPKWLVNHWVTHYGLVTTEEIAQSLLAPVKTTVRANISRGSVDDIINKLENEGFNVEKMVFYLLFACKRANYCKFKSV